MFTTEAKTCFKFREAIIHAYHEQGKELEVIFQCKDGEQRCSRLALNSKSDYFTEQLEGRDRMKNKPVFNYEYPKQVVKNFLDILHTRDIDHGLIDVLRLIKFLRDEGKSEQSTFEKTLLETLIEQLEKADLAAGTKLIICLICNTFDTFDGVMIKVRQ